MVAFSERRPSSEKPGPRTIGVIGGGTAGYFAALALKRRFPDIDVTVVQSRAVPIIGVGEATTTLMPPFLHHELGLDIVALWTAVRPTFKLGIKFVWGPRRSTGSRYPFGEAWPVDAFVFERDLRRQSVTSMLMAEARGPVVRAPDGGLLSLLPSLKFAYHLDNEPFVAHLAEAASTAGIKLVDVTLEGAERCEGGIACLRADGGKSFGSTSTSTPRGSDRCSSSKPSARPSRASPRASSAIARSSPASPSVALSNHARRQRRWTQAGAGASRSFTKTTVATSTRRNSSTMTPP